MEFFGFYTPTELIFLVIGVLSFAPLLATLYAFISKRVTIYFGRESKTVGQLWKQYALVVIFSLVVETIVEFLLNKLWGTAIESNIYLDYLDTGLIYLLPLLVEIWMVNRLISDKQENLLGIKLSTTIVLVNFLVLMSIAYGLIYGLDSFLS